MIEWPFIVCQNLILWDSSSKNGKNAVSLSQIINKYMETTRQNKISRLIQKELSMIFQSQTRQMPGVLVSVSAVRISPDMSVCRVYLSVFPSERAEEIVKNVNDNMKSIRFELGTKVGKQLRIIPELKFFIDDSLDYIDNIDRLLKQ